MNIPIPLLVLALLPLSLFAQNSTSDTSSVIYGQKNSPYTDDISSKSLDFVDKKFTSLSNTVDSQTVKMLQHMQRKEAKLQKKLQGIDSSKAQQLFANSASQYQQLQAKLQAPISNSTVNKVKQYLPGIDSMGTAMHFLTTNNSISTDKLTQIQNVSDEAQQLQGRMQQASDVQAFIQQREQQLKDQLGQYQSLSSQLLDINKEAYYYQQRLQQYKDLANDPEKLGEAILSTVSSLPVFQSFMQKFSLFSQLFPQQPNVGTSMALVGLQTRTQLQNVLQNSLGISNMPSAGTGGQTNYIQQQFQQAQNQLSTLKNKLTELGSGSSDMVMPDFTPNSQHTKSFLSRLEYGYNFQTSAATTLLPSICNIGITLGYKLSDKATIGLGTNYQLGLGRGINHFSLSNQGIGLRSYMDWKIPNPKGRGWSWVGSLWVTGGYEKNYMQAFAKFSDLRNVNVWQNSALLGITKKYKIGQKQGDMQLLYDFLANQEIPHGQPVKFRIGWLF